jgi:hypothetical protein
MHTHTPLHILQGLQSFFILMIKNTLPQASQWEDWFLTFDFLDSNIHWMAFLLIFQSACMIYFAVRQKKFYDRISATSTLHVVEDIRECESPLFHWPYIAYDSGKLREGAEYKLLQLIFLQEYALPKGFDFSIYMQHALEENITKTIQVSTLYNTACTI